MKFWQNNDKKKVYDVSNQKSTQLILKHKKKWFFCIPRLVSNIFIFFKLFIYEKNLYIGVLYLNEV